MLTFLNEVDFPLRKMNGLFFLSDLGLPQHRLDGNEYLAVVDEFMEAVFTRWPNVIVQVLIVTDV